MGGVQSQVCSDLEMIVFVIYVHIECSKKKQYQYVDLFYYLETKIQWQE